MWSFCALCWGSQGGSLSNEFEAAVFKRQARLGSLRRRLLKQGAAEAALAGSGSAVFGIFRNPAQARRAAKQFPEDQVFLCTTISRAAYTRALWGDAGASGLTQAPDRANSQLG
jgi:4-diphosphocytidyl-2C-methyl-D-erythritol kinase